MPKLLDQVRSLLRLRHYSPRTELAYIFWIKKFIQFHGLRHPAELGCEEVTAYLSYLATDKHVAASTQNQALSAILFLYRDVLTLQLPWLAEFKRAPRSRHVPVVLSLAEARSVLAHLTGTYWLMASLLYGSGLRLTECCTLRVKDIDFAYRQITVRAGKGGKDRVTVLPSSVAAPLSDHLTRVKALHEKDFARGYGRAPAERHRRGGRAERGDQLDRAAQVCDRVNIHTPDDRRLFGILFRQEQVFDRRLARPNSDRQRAFDRAYTPVKR